MHDSRSSDRKLHLGWISAAVCALLTGLFLVQLLGPSPAIIASQETTYITEPLRTNGLPDYEAYWRQQASVGITPENNAAPLIWKALWPGELSEQHWLPLCAALDMDRIPDPKAALIEPYDDSITKQVALNLAKSFAESAGDENQAIDYSGADWQSLLNSGKADDAIMAASTRPWSSNQLPTLARWVKDNQQPLDLLVEASKRPRYYSPSPSMLNNSEDLLLAMLLPEIQMMRSAARSLPIRAMWLLSDGRSLDAWSDLLACHRLARLTAENNTLVGQLVAMAIEGIACRSTNVLLHHGNLSAAEARQILADLNSLGPASFCARAIDQGERLTFLDAVLYFATGEADAADFLGTPSEPLHALSFARINWNSALRAGNTWYDRMAAAVKIPQREERLAALDQIDFDLAQLFQQTNSPSNVLGGLFSQQRRSEIVGNLLMGLLLPASRAAINAADRTHVQFTLTKLASALAVYRAEQGEYPAQLSDLSPRVTEGIPPDIYSGKPLLYQRQNDGGYLLYSVFENEIDDNGTDMGGEIIDGEWVEEQPEDFDYSESDIVIRVPMPEFKFPAPPTR
ncbi:MAG: hypothetical protein ACR2NM_13675 [Bythopirellula sp.]